MSHKKTSLETQIAEALKDSLAADRKLSKKAIDRIEKTAGKLSEKLEELFAKEDEKAAKKRVDKKQPE
ncbi:hypothetical protein GCM10007423_11980 [Dyadobacter endophyticus]|uniref:Uncharacterized protein n=1 Tax=Dyadobacter endophyticus TaxID=1749036 RepID=A0ABQ1YJ11_9BACT|nr:hypothetical protein [Dyadobacter endophyticus]GGH26746.1 hypothetical protein GCM10007423_11980 [Dyadobacter endophyticus]